MGLSPDEFWSLTPRHFSGLLKRWREKERRTDQRLAALMTLYANAHRDPQRKPTPFTVDDFLGSGDNDHSTVQNPEDNARYMKLLARLYNGTVRGG